MATASEHYGEAQRLLQDVSGGAYPEHHTKYIDMAQVHATLAVFKVLEGMTKGASGRLPTSRDWLE